MAKKKSAQSQRFEKTYTQGALSGMEIWVDKQTGINYLFGFSGYAGGLTVLLDSDGKPTITPMTDDYDDYTDTSK